MGEELCREVWRLVELPKEEYHKAVSEYSTEELRAICYTAFNMLSENQQAEVFPLIMGRAADE